MIEGVLVDLSGVLYVGKDEVPGAHEALGRLKKSALPVRYVTNTSRSTTEAIREKLRGFGFDIEERELLTAPHVVATYLRQHGLRPFLLIHPGLEPEFAEFQTENPNAVVLGDAGDVFSYDNLNRAFRLLLEEGAKLISMGDNHYFMESEGLSLDIGPFIKALEYAADTKALILGKPSEDFFTAAVKDLGCPADRAVMIGDDILSDIGGALHAGLQGILVKTGKYREGDEMKLDNRNFDLVKDIGEAVTLILERVIRDGKNLSEAGGPS
jgi:HAD superfamily hydrolase (TIGR01458 family)